jgi:hypothetical protein
MENSIGVHGKIKGGGTAARQVDVCTVRFAARQK